MQTLPLISIAITSHLNANTLIAGLILVFLIAASLAYVVGLYNRLVMLKNNIAKAYANIDVLLMQRADEVPNLVAIVKASKDHEKLVLSELTELRARFNTCSDNNQRIKLSNQMQTAWSNTIAVAEAYPNLKSGAAFLALQTRMTEIENHVADRREFFNESVTMYNTGITEFPAILMAVLFGYREKSLLGNAAKEKRS